MASDLGLHYLPMSHKNDIKHICAKMQLFCLSHKTCRNGKYIVEKIFQVLAHWEHLAYVNL